MLPQRVNNPLAPACYNGLSSIGTGFEDKLFYKSFTVTLTANQNLLNQSVQMDKDADFYWLATTFQAPNQPFAVRFSDSTGYQLSEAYIGSTAFLYTTGIGAPFTFVPAFWLPAGSAIIVDFIEQSGLTNGPISIMFEGLKRFKS